MKSTTNKLDVLNQKGMHAQFSNQALAAGLTKIPPPEPRMCHIGKEGKEAAGLIGSESVIPFLLQPLSDVCTLRGHFCLHQDGVECSIQRPPRLTRPAIQADPVQI